MGGPFSFVQVPTGAAFTEKLVWPVAAAVTTKLVYDAVKWAAKKVRARFA